MTDRAEGTRRLYRLHDEGIEAVRALPRAGLGRGRRALQARGREHARALMEPLVLEFTVGCPPEHAFAVWAERTSLWWPTATRSRPTPSCRRVRAARRRPDLRAHARRRGARLGRGRRLGAAAPARLPGTCARTPPTPPRSRSRSRRPATAVTRCGSCTAAGSGSARGGAARAQRARVGGLLPPTSRNGPRELAREEIPLSETFQRGYVSAAGR